MATILTTTEKIDTRGVNLKVMSTCLCCVSIFVAVEVNDFILVILLTIWLA